MHILVHNQLNTVIKLAKNEIPSILLSTTNSENNDDKKNKKNGNATLTLDQGKATHLGGLQFLLKQYFRCGDR